MKDLILCLVCLCGAYGGPITGPRAPPTPEKQQVRPEIKSLHIRSEIAFRFSTTHVTSKLANQNADATEATFHVTLPKTAFMTNFSMNINGTTIYGEVKEKEKAKAQYERAQSQGQSAGYIAATKRDSNKFDVTVNVEAGKEVTFDLEYQEVLQRRLGYYEHVINIDPGQIVPDLQVEVNINESRPITKLKVPPIRKKDNTQGFGDKTHPDATVLVNQENSAAISYKPSEEQQKADSDKGINGQFIVQYDVQRSLDGGELEVVNGYFVHALAPEGLPPVPKNILFILDVSGSMSGRKMIQVKDAMATILDDVRHDDTFNLLTFDDRFTFWKKELQKVDDDSIKKAKEFVTNMRARGMTDIDGAISRGIRFLDDQEQSDQERPSIIIFLTDGDPTQGETNIHKIMENIRNLNQEKYTLFSLGFGRNLNFNFLKQMSLQNGGLARKIYEASDASIQLKNFYKEVSIPILSDVHIKYQVHGGEVSQVTKHVYKTFFSGGELMVAGKVNLPSSRNTGVMGCYIRPCLYGKSAMGKIQICPPSPWPPRPWPPVTPRPPPSWVPETGLAGYVERMWAYLTIRELLDKELRETNDTKKDQLKKKALAMSLKFKFVTPLTSMVVTLPEKPNATLGELRDSAETRGGRYLFSQRSPRFRSSSFASYPRYYAQSGPMGLPGRIGLSGRPAGVPRYYRNQYRRTTTTTTTPAPTTPSIPVLGSPSMVIRLPSGVVCLSWPQMSHSGHILLRSHNEPEYNVQVLHGQKGASKSVMVRTNSSTYLVTPSQMLLEAQLRPWNQPFVGQNVTVSGNTVTFELDDGVKLAVHKVNNANLVLELIEISGLSPSTTGILKNVNSWSFTSAAGGGLILTGRNKGTTQFVTSSASAGGITCQAADKDIFDVADYSRRA